MEASSFLLFHASTAIYAVPVAAVLEILPLPGISPLEEVPKFVVGMIDLRGTVVPVIDLNQRFGRARHPYTSEQCLVVLKRDGPALGMIVDSVEAVTDIDAGDIVPPSAYGAFPPDSNATFISGVVKTGEGLVMMLDLDHLLDLSQTLTEEGKLLEGINREEFFLNHNEDQAELFKERSMRFALPVESHELSTGVPLALVRIGQEFFGIELSAIREFADMRQVTPVPCCPAFVVGQMNLRGEIVTLFDVSGALTLTPPVEQSNRKVVVMENREFGAGILVDDLLDVLSLRQDDICPVPHSIRDVRQEHRRGTAVHGARMFSLIDVPALLANGSLAVNENP